MFISLVPGYVTCIFSFRLLKIHRFTYRQVTVNIRRIANIHGNGNKPQNYILNARTLLQNNCRKPSLQYMVVYQTLVYTLLNHQSRYIAFSDGGYSFCSCFQYYTIPLFIYYFFFVFLYLSSIPYNSHNSQFSLAESANFPLKSARISLVSLEKSVQFVSSEITLLKLVRIHCNYNG